MANEFGDLYSLSVALEGRCCRVPPGDGVSRQRGGKSLFLSVQLRSCFSEVLFPCKPSASRINTEYRNRLEIFRYDSAAVCSDGWASSGLLPTLLSELNSQAGRLRWVWLGRFSGPVGFSVPWDHLLPDTAALMGTPSQKSSSATSRLVVTLLVVLVNYIFKNIF